MVATAIVGAAAIGAVGNIVGAQSAAGAQESAANNANERLAPFVGTGYNAAGSLNNLLTNPQTGLEKLPGYQFTLNQGLESVQNGYAARGLGSSGAALKGAANYATGLANSTYGDQFNRLLNASSLGENAAAQVGTNLIGAGNAQAGANIATGNAVGNAAGSIGNTLVLNQLTNGGIFGNPNSSGSEGGLFGF